MKLVFPEISPGNENLLPRALLAMVMIVAAASLRIAPHPWNLTPVGAVALFSGAILRDWRLAFIVPALALFAGDCFVGFHVLMPVVYASFLINVAIGRFLQNRRSVRWIGAAALMGAVQFFVVTNFGVWWLLGTYPKNPAGLVACYVAGIPFFWNTLAGDALYSALLFGGFALAERTIPQLHGVGLRHSQ